MTTVQKTNRFILYVLLAGLSILTPYILTMIFIIAYSDREDGMTTAVIPGLLTVHLIFGLIYIRHKFITKALLTIVLTAATFALVYLGMVYKVINTGWDLYQFWDLAIINFISGLIIWEIYYQIDLRITKKADKG